MPLRLVWRSSSRRSPKLVAGKRATADNVEMPALDPKIDDLYRQPLETFIEARTALAKSLSGDDAKQVRKLAKPTVVPWAVNQVYWHARSLFDAVMTSGARLRKAQVAALEGRKADVRTATEEHRRAVADAAREAARLAAAAGSQPSPDQVMRTFEALSLAAEPPDTPGRLTRPLQPSGFEALGGLRVKAAPAPSAAQTAAAKRTAKKDEEARRKAEAAQKKHDAEIKRAEAALERAREKMAKAQALLRETRNREP
jgi:hypothetical protein